VARRSLDDLTNAEVFEEAERRRARLYAAAVLESLSTHPGESDDGPKLLDRAGLGRAIGKSPSSIDRLVREGMPFIPAGAVKRFSLPDVIAWMSSRQQREPVAAE
jgi:hypothetical protein